MMPISRVCLKAFMCFRSGFLNFNWEKKKSILNSLLRNQYSSSSVERNPYKAVYEGIIAHFLWNRSLKLQKKPSSFLLKIWYCSHKLLLKANKKLAQDDTNKLQICTLMNGLAQDDAFLNGNNSINSSKSVQDTT